MKYALIVMVAVYLVTFGCNPKTEEENTTPQNKVEHEAITETPTAPAELTITTQVAVQTTPEAGPANHDNVATDKAPAAPANVVVTTEKVDKEAKPAAKEHSAVEVKNALPVVEKATPAAENTETTNSNQWKNIAQAAATTVLALMNDDQNTQPAQVAEAPAVKKVAVKPATEAVTILPCGKKVSQVDTAKNYPCVKHSKKVAQQPAVPAEETELSEAMQKMVNATNDMVTVTRHLVIATQRMLAASKDVAVEVIDTGKDAIENSKPAVQNAVNEKEIIETVKEVLAATREAYEATSEALSNAIEAQEAQPAPEATPQQ